MGILQRGSPAVCLASLRPAGKDWTLLLSNTRSNRSSNKMSDNDSWQNVDHNVEQFLDGLRGGDLPAYDLAWRYFLRLSAYSPVRLDNELGWKPTPNGVGSRSPVEFSWLDAFEDLLFASSGRPMKQLEDDEDDEDQSLADLSRTSPLLRLQAFQISEVYFPVCEPVLVYRSPRTMSEWIELRKQGIPPLTEWMPPGRRDDLEELKMRPGSLERAHRKLGTDELSPFTYGQYARIREAEEKATQQHAPQTEEDLYLAHQDGDNAARPSRTLFTFYKNLFKNIWAGTAQQPKQPTVLVESDEEYEVIKVQGGRESCRGGNSLGIEVIRLGPSGQLVYIEKHEFFSLDGRQRRPFTSRFWALFWEANAKSGGAEPNWEKLMAAANEKTGKK
ncbi:hypothetical protein B0H66DRAFT_536671 [Apodospora peruviana]|uniref:Uncharacterized protein n=1 Tax=Apodospora peruviana TaxID=516989 RepID=A0AAE0HV06_9PEZI|nr:hypothetical protein B0H66DRAFT_536671 [Apodospora peruviana]